MKVKRTVIKEMHLGELITYIFENDIRSRWFHAIGGENDRLNVNEFGSIDADDTYSNKSTRYKVEITEEIEIDLDTEIELGILIDNRNQSVTVRNFTINRDINTDFVKLVYLQNNDGSIEQLIWSKEEGLIQ